MILQGDALEQLRTLPDGAAQMCVTSPPYWGLRDYGTATWDGGDAQCDHKIPAATLGGGSNKGHSGSFTANYPTVCRCGAVRIDRQLGLEPTPDAYVVRIVDVFREVRRVLKDDGVTFLNLGDSYSAQPGQRKSTDAAGQKQQSNEGSVGAPSRCVEGLKPKDLVGIPWMVAFALRADGWYLRQDIIWAKPNPMPESVRDRCTKSHEYLFLLSKSERYLYDAAAIAEQCTESSDTRYAQDIDSQAGSDRVPGKTNGTMKAVGGPRSKSHYAAANIPGQSPHGYTSRDDGRTNMAPSGTRNKRDVWTIATQGYSEAHFATFPPALVEPCIKAGSRFGDTVLDPFLGSGTTAAVAANLGRECIGIELNAEYLPMIERRLQRCQLPLDVDLVDRTEEAA